MSERSGDLIATAFEDVTKAITLLRKNIEALDYRVTRLEKWQKDECSI